MQFTIPPQILIYMSIIIQSSGQDELNQLDHTPPKISILLVDPTGSKITLYPNVQNEDIILSQLPVMDKDKNIPSNPEPNTSASYQYYELRCIASFPIEFTYEGEGTPQVKTSSYRHLQNGPREFQNSSSYMFEIRLILKPKESNSGNYLCRSVHNYYVDNHVYTYIPGPQVFIANQPENLGLFGLGGEDGLGNQIGLATGTREEIFLGPHSQGSLLVIPCAVSDPREDIDIRLYEKITKYSKTVFQDMTHTAKFYPKKGFLLKAGNTSKSSREFKCESVDPKSTRFNASISFVLLPTFENVTLGINYTAKEPDHIFTCTTLPEDQAVFFGRKDCSSPMDCKLMEIRLRKSYFPRIMTNPIGSFSLTYRTMNVPIPDGKLGISGQRTGSVLPISGIFFCSCGRSRLTSLVYNSFQHLVVTDLSNKPRTSDLLKVVQLQNTDDPTFLCIGRAYFYSHGFVWSLETEDERTEFLEGEERQSQSPFIRSKLTLPGFNQSGSNWSVNINSLVCYAPLLGSHSLWDNVSFSMNGSLDTEYDDYFDNDIAASKAALYGSIKEGRMMIFLTLFTIPVSIF